MTGKVIGSYRITEKIGEGGMGAVFKGVDTMLEREVAIKMLRPDLASQPDIVERFRTEAVTLAKLNHPNIATLYSFLREGEDFFMAMEFVRGHTLDELIRSGGAIECNRAIKLFCQALEGIDHAHRMGIVHRDIKPANIMLTESGSIKVMDFGIARALGSARMTRQGNVVGTVEYMSPEQVRGQAADARSDIYSLGILLYEMLTGRVPFQSDSEFELMRAQIEDAPKPPRTFSANIPLPVEQAIMRSLAKKPDARPQTAGELRATLLASMGAKTSPIPAGSSYSAPTTRVLETPTEPIPAQQAGRRTGSSDSPAETMPFAQSTVSAKSTGDQSRATIADQLPIPEPVKPSGQKAVRTTTSPAQLSKFTWKHYAAVAVLLVVAVAALSFALRESRTEPDPVATTEEEAAASSSESSNQEPAQTPAAATQAESAAAAVTPEEAPANAEGKSDRVLGATNANVDRFGRAKANRNERAPETPAPTEPAAAVPLPPPVTPPPPQQTQTTAGAVNQPPAPNSAPSANQNQNASRKKGGIGGFFKKVFGSSEKKKANKNQ